MDVIDVDPAEPHAANVLRLGHTIVCAASHERTAADLRARGYDVCAVDVSELAKAEAGVTCCSLIIDSFQLPAVQLPATKPGSKLKAGSWKLEAEAGQLES